MFLQPVQQQRPGVRQQLSGSGRQLLDSLFRFQDAATACSDLANQLLTTVLDGYGRRWMLRTADTTEG